MNPHFFTAPFFDWRDRRSDRETQTLWILEVLHGRMTKGGNASSHSFSIRCGSQPPPLQGTSFQRKEGRGRMVKAIYPLSVEGGCPKGRGLASFFAAKPPSLSLPPWGRGTASAVDRVLSLMAHLRRSPPSLSYR